MTSWIPLESMLLYRKLSIFRSLNIVFHLQPVYRSFSLSPTMLFGLGFRVLSRQFCWTPARLLPEFKATPDKIWVERNNYIGLTDIFEIPWQETKDLERMVVSVFGIEIDTNLFTARLPRDNLHKECELSAAELIKQIMTLLKAKKLTGLLCFCTKVIRLGWVFMRSLWDLLAKFLPGHPDSRWRILWQVRDNLSWWINLLLKFNGVQFFDNERQETY